MDWRSLLTDHEKGLELLNKLENDINEVLKKQYWENEDWKKQVYKNDMKDVATFEDFQETIIYGFNYPPSQSQLHMQAAATPLMPFHHNKFMNNNHFHNKRWLKKNLASKSFGLLHYPWERVRL